MTTVEVRRSLPAGAPALLAAAFQIPLRAVLTASGSPALPGIAASRILRSRLDAGCFGFLMSLGFSVSSSQPLRELTLTRSIPVKRDSPSWVHCWHDDASAVGTILIHLDPHGTATTVTVSCSIDCTSLPIGRLLSVLLMPARRWLNAYMIAWLSTLEGRVLIDH